MKLTLIALLVLLIILLFMIGGGVRVPGETTQKEQRVIRGMSVIVEDF